MSLLQPLGLLGLLSLPVIVLLHLWHERNKHAVIPSLTLWSWLEREVRGPQMRLPPITPVLLLQLTAAALLSLALARPRLDFLDGPAVLTRLVVVMDTSTSMAATDVSPNRLGWAKGRASQLLAGLSAHDSVALVTAGPQPRLVADSRQVGVTGLLAELLALEPAGVGQDWPATLALAAAAGLPEHQNRIVVYSDGAFVFPEALTAAGAAAELSWQTVGGPQPNQAVVALAARPTGTGGLQVFARLANFSDRAAERTVTLTANNEVLDTHTVRLNAAGTLGQVWTLPPGVASVQLSLSGGSDVLPADDTAALGLHDTRLVEAVLVAEPEAGAAVARALRSIATLRLTEQTPAQYTPFAGHELTVFVGWLPEAGQLPQGGVLIFDPPTGSAALPVTGYTRLGSVPPPSGDPLFDDVDLEHVFFGTAAQVAQQAWLAPALRDDSVPRQTLIWRGSQGGSRMVVFSLMLPATNLARRAAFPILVANAVAEVLPPALPASVPAGQAISLPPAEIFPALTVTTPDGAAAEYGAGEVRAFGATTQTGLYTLAGTFTSGQPWQAAVGVNAGALDESDLRAQARPSFAAPSGVAGASPSEGLELWPLLVGLVALALLVEARLAWR